MRNLLPIVSVLCMCVGMAHSSPVPRESKGTVDVNFAEIQALAEKGYQLWKEGKIINGSYTDPIPEQQGFEFQAQGDMVAVAYGNPGWFQWRFKIQDDKLVFSENLADKYYPHSQRKDNSDSLLIDSFTLCSRVENKEPVEPIKETVISAKKIYFWTAVQSTEIPTFVEHVWLHDGKEVARIKLDITYSKTRTWSSKNLMSGKWEVRVMTKSGTVLTSAQFEVE